MLFASIGIILELPMAEKVQKTGNKNKGPGRNTWAEKQKYI